MIRQTRWFATTLTILLLHGCAGTQVRVDFDPKENFPSLRHYAWATPTSARW
jgi:hypothetical protein